MKNRPTAIFVESNTSGSGAEFLQRALELGLVPIFLTATTDRYPFLQDLDSIETHICDTSSIAAVSRCIDAVNAENSIALIMSSSDHYLDMAALQASRLGLVGAHLSAITLCRNKASQAEVLKAASVDVPLRSVTISTVPEIPRAIAKIGLPAIVKPVNGTGSIGVSLVRTKAEAVDALSVLLSVTMNERGQSVPSSALLMSYVEGDEFSVEIIDGKVMGVTQKHLGPLPFFVETGHDYPAPVSDELYGRIGTEAQRAVKALGHSSGPAHVEVRVNTNGITIIEVNPRLAGGSIPRLMHYATGVDPIAAVIESACGRHPEIQSSSSNFGSLRFIVPSTNGLFQPPCQSAELAEKFGLTEVSYYHKTPITFQRRNDFRDRLGHVIAVDSDPVAAAHRAEAAIAFICKS